MKHNNDKFYYDNEGIANRKHIIADRVRLLRQEIKQSWW